jgi:stearoyl-CoA desaturase (delta-9 desaturase)
MISSSILSSPSILTSAVAVVLCAMAVTQISIITTSVYLHRGLAHRALNVRPTAELPARIIIWMTTGMKPREWAAIHRKHHAATDTPEDPHSPIVHGFWRVQLGNVGLYRAAAKNELIAHKYARDLRADRLDKALFDHALLGLGIGIALLVAFTSAIGLGPWVGLIAAGLHAVLYVMLSGAINAMGHRFGKRPYENSATNAQWLALITGGEGLHNNHHAAPTSARFSLHRRELDPGWLTIRLLTALKCASVRHEDVKLKRVAA